MDKYLDIKSKNPTWGYKRIAKAMGQPESKTRWWHANKHIPTPIQTANWLKSQGLLPLNVDNQKLSLISKVIGATFGDGGMFENLNAISIVRRLVVNNVSLRRTISVSEMLGWDKDKNDFKIKEIFRWNAENDTYNHLGKSVLVEKIADQWGYSREEISQELEMRKTILEYMVRKHIRTYDDVSKLVLDYFSDPERIYRKAKVS